MSSEGVIVVRGRGSARAVPDEVEVTFEVKVLSQAADDALAEAAGQARALEEILNQAGIDAKSRITSGISVREEREWEDRRYIHRGYVASQDVVVRLAEASKIGTLMMEATNKAHASINGPRWRVAPSNPARAEACTLAALDAKGKADAYAAALGARLGAVVSVNEPGLEMPRHHEIQVAMMSASMDAAEEMPIQAGELDVFATVDVTFRIEQ
jgi:uncharacterized protein